MKQLLLLFAAVIALASCASTSNFVEAESLGASNQSFLIGVEGTFVAEENYSPIPIPLGIGVFNYGRGLTDRLDLRGTVRTNFTSEIGVKYQFHDTEKTDLAAGLNLNLGLAIPGPELVFYSQFNVGSLSVLVNPSLGFVKSIYTNASQALPGEPQTAGFGPEIGLATGLMFGAQDQFKIALNARFYPTGVVAPVIYGVGFAYDIKPGFEESDSRGSKAKKGKKKKKKKKKRRRRRR